MKGSCIAGTAVVGCDLLRTIWSTTAEPSERSPLTFSVNDVLGIVSQRQNPKSPEVTDLKTPVVCLDHSSFVSQVLGFDGRRFSPRTLFRSRPRRRWPTAKGESFFFFTTFTVFELSSDSIINTVFRFERCFRVGTSSYSWSSESVSLDFDLASKPEFLHLKRFLAWR